ncbi:hypothetical protein APHAL10511_001992 [Amanita phalloides]|nr:hypothetical protein APHAL10511_001992 [Amanita phalloides]
MPDGEPRARSSSLNADDSDLESHIDGTPSAPGKPGRKRNPNSQAARRDQNRIAQREFRLRKQQRIRDLEARVEILSGGKDEAMSEMRNILKDLMAENHTLRTLLKSLGAFIGDGAGGLLPKLGWDVSDFNNLINKSETDTAWESFQRRKKLDSSPSVAASTPSSTKRRSEDEISNVTKKARVSLDGESDRTQNGFPLVMPMNPGSLASNNMYTSAPAQDNNAMFSSLIRGSATSPIFMQASPPGPASSQYGPPSSGLNNYQTSYVPGVNINIEPLSAISFNPGAGAPPDPRVTATQLSTEQLDDEDDQNKMEAYKLITYHLDNFKRNASYCLPASLRPTLVQRTVPHESVIDRILHPELRDRMILLRGRYDLVDCLFDYRSAISIHGDDVLAHGNWELSEKWLRQYGFLIDQATLNVCNRWRRERGEAELRLTDITPSEQSPSAS